MTRKQRIIATLLGAFAFGGLLAIRRALRAGATSRAHPHVPDLRKGSAPRPSDVRQGVAKAAKRTEYTPVRSARASLLRILRQEERRQRPQEGRN